MPSRHHRHQHHRAVIVLVGLQNICGCLFVFYGSSHTWGTVPGVVHPGVAHPGGEGPGWMSQLNPRPVAQFKNPFWFMRPSCSDRGCPGVAEIFKHLFENLFNSQRTRKGCSAELRLQRFESIIAPTQSTARQGHPSRFQWKLLDPKWKWENLASD